jgi:hypothetical protein
VIVVRSFCHWYIEKSRLRYIILLLVGGARERGERSTKIEPPWTKSEGRDLLKCDMGGREKSAIERTLNQGARCGTKSILISWNWGSIYVSKMVNFVLTFHVHDEVWVMALNSLASSPA